MQSKIILCVLVPLLFAGSAKAREGHSAAPPAIAPQFSENQTPGAGSPDLLVNRGQSNGNGARHDRRISLTGSGDRVAILLDLNRAEEWSYNRATGAMIPVAPGSLYFTHAIPGSGIILTHAVSTGPARILIPTNAGNAEIPTLDSGSYNLTVRLPGSADSSAHAKSRKAAVITFHLNVGSDGIVRDRSPEIAIAALNQKSSAVRK
jgi:hypothetical protein